MLSREMARRHHLTLGQIWLNGIAHSWQYQRMSIEDLKEVIVMGCALFWVIGGLIWIAMVIFL